MIGRCPRRPAARALVEGGSCCGSGLHPWCRVTWVQTLALSPALSPRTWAPIASASDWRFPFLRTAVLPLGSPSEWPSWSPGTGSGPHPLRLVFPRLGSVGLFLNPLLQNVPPCGLQRVNGTLRLRSLGDTELADLFSTFRVGHCTSLATVRLVFPHYRSWLQMGRSLFLLALTCHAEIKAVHQVRPWAGGASSRHCKLGTQRRF